MVQPRDLPFQGIAKPAARRAGQVVLLESVGFAVLRVVLFILQRRKVGKDEFEPDLRPWLAGQTMKGSAELGYPWPRGKMCAVQTHLREIGDDFHLSVLMIPARVG